jgi:hypothetical protein
MELRDLNEMVVCDLNLLGEIYECAEFYDAAQDRIVQDLDSYMLLHGVLIKVSGKEAIFCPDDYELEDFKDASEDDVYLFENVQTKIVTNMRGYVDYRKTLELAA